MRFLLLIFLITTTISLISPEDIVEDNQTFVPTKEWREIKKGLYIFYFIIIAYEKIFKKK